jgi:transcriptional regulator
MYVPEVFLVRDRATLLAHVARYPFATLVTHGEDGIGVTHLPLLWDASRDVLRGHLAAENPQVAHLAERATAVAIFHGPHGYVSPSVYTVHPSVPTWNYVVVHAHGRARLVDLPTLRAILDEAVARFDTSDWRLDESEEFLPRMLGKIVGFELAVERFEGKWKVSQNRSPEDRERVAEWLERGDDSSRELARIMREENTR